MTPRLPPRSARRFAVLAGALTAATLAAVLMARDGSGDRLWPWRESPPPSILLTAAPQDGNVFLTWSPVPDASYILRWRVAEDSEWRIVPAGSLARRVVSDLRNLTAYAFQVEARQHDATVGLSGVVTATPRPRPGCVTLDYMPGPPRASFFCTKAALDDYLKERSIDPLSMRCRQQPVRAWTDDVPNCRYVTPAGEHLLLLRSADSVFSGGNGYPTSAVVRQYVRRAIWGRDDPFDAPDQRTAPLRPLAVPIVGKVTRHRSARSFEVPSSRGSISNVTWFTPTRPVPGRFSIYHEGHGGAAVEIGADTIDWLLDRGWQVVAVDMPLIGANEAARRPGLTSHADFDSLDDGVVSPLENFLLPVKSVVDAIVKTTNGADPDILLIGRSGGGWTTYVYAALDPRIDIAVSVAGGRPISARLDAPWGAAELGDYEQSVPHLYDVTPHEHLMLAAGSKGAFYVFNRWDTCCYRVAPGDPFVRYLRQSADKPIQVIVDEQHHAHSMGPNAYPALGRFLARVLTK